MNAPESMVPASDNALGATRERRCAICPTLFTAKRSWQKFCSPACRNTYHGSMTPEALRRDVDELKRRLAVLEAKA